MGPSLQTPRLTVTGSECWTLLEEATKSKKGRQDAKSEQNRAQTRNQVLGYVIQAFFFPLQMIIFGWFS